MSKSLKQAMQIALFVLSVFAANNAMASSGSVSAEDMHNGLRALKSTMENALNQRDIDTILQNIDENVVFTTMNGDVVRGKKQVKEYFVKMMTGPDRVIETVTSKFEADDLSILHEGNIAVAFGHSDDSYTLTSGENFLVKARWSGTMQLRKDGWKIISFHYSTNMFDNPILDVQRQVMIWITVGASAIAAIVFFLLGRFFSRRKM